MMISSKGRNAICALIEMALQDNGSCIAVSALARRLDISKLYLEQIFALLKRGGLLLSVKGKRGGYLLRSKPELITLWDILSITELHLSARTENDAEALPPEMKALLDQLVVAPLCGTVRSFLMSVTLADLAKEVSKTRSHGFTYLI